MLNTKHFHDWKEDGNYLVCSVEGCSAKKLKLSQVSEDMLLGTKDNGIKYSVRKNRKSWFMPDLWINTVSNLSSDRAKKTANILIQTGARIMEARHIEKRDFDWDRNTIKLRITKTKARKAGEERGNPRTIPINSEFMKEMKKFFRDKSDNAKIDILSTAAFNIALKKAVKEAGIKDYYMYSAHNIRKTHGNWLKILGNIGMMKVDATEICLRLGHDYNTFLKDYGSSGVMNPSDTLLAKKILGDLYAG